MQIRSNDYENSSSLYPSNNGYSRNRYLVHTTYKAKNMLLRDHQYITSAITLSGTLYHWRKIEPVTMKANFIHFWCVESEFMIKNWFHNWTSVLGCIWHIFGKFRLFLALFWKSWYSSNGQHYCQQGSVYLQQLVVASTEVLEKCQIFQKCAKCTLTLMSNHEINFWHV